MEYGPTGKAFCKTEVRGLAKINIFEIINIHKQFESQAKQRRKQKSTNLY